MKGIYLASFQAKHDGYKIDYQDINGKRDIGGDMLEIDIRDYDYVIATPPCNYWSRANWRRETSSYSQQTKHLLPGILEKLVKMDKPFIVENVRNKKRFTSHGLMDLPVYIYEIGRHTYWTNIEMGDEEIVQQKDNIQNITKSQRQGSDNVHNVIEHWLKKAFEEMNKKEQKVKA